MRHPPPVISNHAQSRKGSPLGLINGSITYKLYRIDDKLPKDLKDTMSTNLAKFAREINPKTNPEMSIGWVNVFNPIDTNLRSRR